MQISLGADQLGRLVCAIAEGSEGATVTASDLPEAAAGLLAAIETVKTSGMSECYWHEGGGEYRWVFRRMDDDVRIAVLWSAGTLTGWEHVFWAETNLAEFDRIVHEEIENKGITLAART